MAKNRVAKALISEGPRMKKERRAEITQCNNGYVIRGGYDPKTGATPQYIAKTESEAKEIASKLL